ncbi:hypothetical protein RND81_06G111000 [Saponaria officinalis]|uniref:Uncharacterized protein n=2 Tax=Saponaria officinalis TaxID=3572 RepID=A0AAW1K5C6_SAPOF
MPSDRPRNTGKKRTCFAQVAEVEKQLWARIHTHGVLDTGVKGLYHKACYIYEKLFLSDNELQELHHIEYLLWRLHYKHIDEFRKTICQNEDKAEDTVSANQVKVGSKMDDANEHMEGFRLFLSEATKFYQDLIRGIKRYNGLFDEPWFYKNDEVSGRMEQTKLHICQFVCHRLCICLGDLARYLELYEKPSHHQRNWAVAACFYLEAAKIYPDGGNPQNQLAVLATYIGEEFLALYHCIRSLAVKEPFPDALQNLMLLFERNRSSDIVSLTNEVHDLRKPSDWISNYFEDRANEVSDSRTLKGAECDPCSGTDFWALFIRMTSFFFLESSLESFASTFTSTLRELEALLACDVAGLSSALQSYQNMNLLKSGPYRALHIVSVLLFIIYNLTADHEHKISKPTKDAQHSELVRLVLTVTFTFMGRLVDRCLKGRPVIYFPLLPALLVFVEWLVGALRELNFVDATCESAMRYFFGSFVELLKHLQENMAEIDDSCNIALWEDYELRGFIPLSPMHELLDFSSCWEDEINYKMKNDFRARRIVQAAIKIASGNKDNSRKWFFYDSSDKKFGLYDGEPNPVEEEEDIVFKPIARHNSEPITLNDGQISEPSDECLRRASSLLVAQNRALIDSLSPTKQPAQNECIPKGSKSNTVPENTIAAGPPSLSSWVLSGDITKNGPTEKTVLTSIAEISPDEPSVPLLTPSAIRVMGNLPGFGLQSGMTHEPPNFVGSSYRSDSQHGSPGIPSSVNHSSPFFAPKNVDSVHGSGASGFGLLDHWSHNDPLASLPAMYDEDSPPLFQPSPSLLHGLHEQRRDIQISDSRKPRQYSPVVSDPTPEPRPLLEYLKRREWQLRQESQFTGSYMQK